MQSCKCDFTKRCLVESHNALDVTPRLRKNATAADRVATEYHQFRIVALPDTHAVLMQIRPTGLDASLSGSVNEMADPVVSYCMPRQWQAGSLPHD